MLRFCQLDTPEKREAQLRICPHPPGLLACMVVWMRMTPRAPTFEYLVHWLVGCLRRTGRCDSVGGGMSKRSGLKFSQDLKTHPIQCVLLCLLLMIQAWSFHKTQGLILSSVSCSASYYGFRCELLDIPTFVPQPWTLALWNYKPN